MTSVKKIGAVKGKYVLVRCDFNVPLKNGKVLDTLRIKAAVPTIELLSKKGARVILISHIGREPEETLKPVAALLKRFVPVTFVPQVLGEKVDKTRAIMKNGDVVLLENLRSNPGEKADDKAFAKALAKLGDFYVNEAFPVSHRADASIVSLPKLLPAFAGLQLEREVAHLSAAAQASKHPVPVHPGRRQGRDQAPAPSSCFLKEADHVFLYRAASS